MDFVTRGEIFRVGCPPLKKLTGKEGMRGRGGVGGWEG